MPNALLALACPCAGKSVKKRPAGIFRVTVDAWQERATGGGDPGPGRGPALGFSGRDYFKPVGFRAPCPDSPARTPNSRQKNPFFFRFLSSICREICSFLPFRPKKHEGLKDF